MENESLDNILNGTSAVIEPEAVVETSAEAPAEQVEAAPERPRDEHGRFLPKSEAEPAPEAAPESASPAPADDQPALEHPALIGERRRRQTAEAENEKLRQQLAQIAQPPVQQLQPQPVPDQWDDPDGWAAHVRQEAAGAATQAALAEVRRERVKVSAEAAKVRYPDYLDKVPVFEQLAAANPALWDQMFQHPDPAEWAYGVVKQHQELSQYGSLEERDKAMKAKWEAEALDALRANLSPQTAPPTLSNERNVGQRSGPEWSGTKSLGDILST